MPEIEEADWLTHEKKAIWECEHCGREFEVCDDGERHEETCVQDEAEANEKLRRKMANDTIAFRKFLIGLEKLSRETGVTIGGCGCCGSPYLATDMDDMSDMRAGYVGSSGSEVNWLSPTSAGWEDEKDNVVKGEASNS